MGPLPCCTPHSPRWKPLHYFLRRYTFRDHLIAASNDSRVLVRSDDAFAPFDGTASLSVLHLASGAVTPLSSFPVSLPRGAGVSTWSCANASAHYLTEPCTPWADLLPTVGCAAAGTDCVLLMALTAADGSLAVDNFELFTEPYNLALPDAVVTASVGVLNANGTVPITVSATETALFVTLTTLASGRFSDNGLIVPPGSVTVEFLPWGPLNATLLASSLRVESLTSYPMNV